jgi:two-component system response regulator QseB
MRILLVEDDDLLGDGLKAGIEDNNWVVDWVRDGEAARSVLKQLTYDAVVLDLELPKRPGIEVLRWLRRRGTVIPVLILSATDTTVDRVSTLNAGADDYVIKPFDLDELCARLRALHRRATNAGLPLIRHGKIEIDPVSRTVHFDGKAVALSPKEFSILQTMVENAGKAVSRERLLSCLYGLDADIGSNALEVHIHHLRRKIHTMPLKAVWGVGYRLD